MHIAEYRILDYAVEVKVPISWLSTGICAEILNKPFHGLSHSELEHMLHKLFLAGDLIATYHVGEYGASFVPSPHIIATTLSGAANDKLQLSYGLTVQGGARWEEVSNPHWDKYVDESYMVDTSDFPDPQEGQITANHRALAEEYLAAVKQYRSPVCCIVPGSEVWEILEPWSVTYWKSLRQGYRVRFLYTQEESYLSREEQQGSLEWAKRKSQWYTRWDDEQYESL
ncbi:MAG: hypothetical protein HC837_15820 [Chloroflexaceae bacterium]|nr:hypothetical protein [Chloroflexaceae bacterium]